MSEFQCPLCDGAMTVHTLGKGDVWVKCHNSCDPQCNETVEAHGSSAKDAHEMACEKFRKAS